MRQFISILTGIIFIAALLAVSGALYTIDETQQVVITQFGKPIGDPITEAGFHFKMPFIQKANFFEERILEWDGDANQIPTKDKKYIWVDTTARWKIVNSLKFLQSLGNEREAHKKLDDIIDSVTRDLITSNNLVEAVRNTNRILDRDIMDEDEDSMSHSDEGIERISKGRENLTRRILEAASKDLLEFGIELVDVRIKRINYVSEVQTKVFDRMISERKRAAEQYRSEGQGKKAEIEGRVSKELNEIRSEAYKKAEIIKGEADAEATTIYAEAYNKDPEFYSFLKTLETYQDTIDKDTTVILTTDSDYMKYLKKSKGN